MAVGAEDGGDGVRWFVREVEIAAKEEAGGGFEGDVFDGVALVAAFGVAKGIEGRFLREGGEARALEDAFADLYPAQVPGIEVGDFFGDAIEFEAALCGGEELTLAELRWLGGEGGGEQKKEGAAMHPEIVPLLTAERKSKKGVPESAS